MASVKPSAQSLARVSRMGTRAGRDAKASGVPERCPFDQSAAPDLYATWSAAYVAAAYRKR